MLRVVSGGNQSWRRLVRMRREPQYDVFASCSCRSLHHGVYRLQELLHPLYDRTCIAAKDTFVTVGRGPVTLALISGLVF